MRVSVIVTTYNAERWIARVLGSLQAQMPPAGSLEIIVVDDGSHDQTADIVRALAAFDSRIRLISQANQGTAGAVTTGLGAATGDILCLLSHDCYAAPDWLASVVSAFRDDPAAGIVQGMILPAGPVDRPFVHCTVVRQPSRSFEGAAIAYRKAAADRAGRYFDPALSRYGDDADFAYRILEAGYRAVWLDRPTAYHEIVPSSFGSGPRSAAGIGTFARLVKRHPAMRRRLRGGFLWGSKYRYLKMAGLHTALAALACRRPGVSAACLALTGLVAAAEARRSTADRPLPPVDRFFLIPAQHLLGELVGTYALIWGSIRWRSPVL